jgi:hypothetical protein
MVCGERDLTLNAYQGLGLTGVFSGVIVTVKLEGPSIVTPFIRAPSKSFEKLTAPFEKVRTERGCFSI